MRESSFYRTVARNALSGRWGTAVIAGLLASLFGATDTEPVSANIDIESYENFSHTALEDFVLKYLVFIIAAAVVIGFFALLIGSVVWVGYARFNINLIEGKTADINQLFLRFYDWKRLTLARFLQGLYVFLWSLLLIIPGIIASYSYSMTGYILAEHPEMSAKDAIALSKEIMQGNKMRLFMLHLSFFGWGLLAVITCGIGGLWVTPYVQAATAVFYRDISSNINTNYATQGVG